MFRLVLAFSILSSLFLSSSAQTCSSYASFASNQVFRTCNDLPYLNAFLYWNYNASSGALQIAYRTTKVTSTTWVSWAINPKGIQPTAMVGAQALVAYQQSNGKMRAYTSQITSYDTQLPESKLLYDVTDLSATFAKNEIIIYATLALPKNSTSINQVWQEGPVSDNAPGAHEMGSANSNSKGTLNILSGQSESGTSGGGGNSKQRKRNIHGVLNAVSWGVLMPIGAIIARYLKVFKSADPAWFYLHVSCQTTAYIVGVAGWATGIKLGQDSPGIVHTKHRTIGILLFVLGTLQVFALLLRPKKEHKFRSYWNIYHHWVGYVVIILSIVNIFEGFDILQPDKKWKHAYTGVVIALAVNAVCLEAYTWCVFIKRRRSGSDDKTLQA